uniref:ALK and LTK ligand 1-like n=1 Tax=Petromyzon marinus TaxID=7757 RepID=A0AAJ7T4Y7_PETMA|nr:ALK and LTK ligand 1-like [Petromyzon marinus]
MGMGLPRAMHGFMEAVCLHLLVGLAFTLQATLGGPGGAGHGGTALLELILDTLHHHGAGHDRPRFGDGSRELVARDPGTRRGAKVKFLKHLTGPLRFSPECARYFQRILHGSRECGDPAYYRRCARLLTRLASSPPCAVRG